MNPKEEETFEDTQQEWTSEMKDEEQEFYEMYIEAQLEL